MLNKTYTYKDVEAAIARASGMQISDIAEPRKSTGRVFKSAGASPYQKGRGHVYAHVATYTQRLPKTDREMQKIQTAQGNKSLWANRRTAIEACMELLNNDPKVKGHLAGYDTPGSKDAIRPCPIDVVNRPLSGDYYGYERNSNTLKKATKGSINIYSVGGELVIFSTYPTQFCGIVESDLELDWLFS